MSFIIHSARNGIMAPRHYQKLIGLLLVFSCILAKPALTWALGPEEIVVVANSSASESLELAKYYMRQRHIPSNHLVQIRTSSDEYCTRTTYDNEIRKPIREALAWIDKNKQIRCLVIMYGVPLAIMPPNPKDNVQHIQLNKRLQALKTDQERAKGQRLSVILAEKLQIEQQIVQIEKMQPQAAVDSELALVLAGEYPLDGWLPNPYFLGYRGQKTLLKKNEVLMVSRLDGPSPPIVRRLVDDAIFAEKKGLQGRAYFDARWLKPDKRPANNGYAFYDAALHTAAEGIRKSGRMKEVRLDSHNELFQPGDCPETALYCGWYSLGQYVNAFTWVRGAIGYHIASSECTTLKKPDSPVWCKRMLEEGVAATMGPVYEPYVQAFPLPDLFFLTLSEGYLGLAESYLISLPYLSWQMVLIGDPLYQPFAPQ